MRWQKGSTQVALGAHKQIQAAVCVWRFVARPSERRLPLLPPAFSSFVGFLDRPPREVRLGVFVSRLDSGWDDGSHRCSEHGLGMGPVSAKQKQGANYGDVGAA